MRKLNNILSTFNQLKIVGNTAIDIHGLTNDSRKIGKGDLFVCLRGFTVDGHQYINKAIENGAVAILLEQMPDTLVEGITYVQVQDTSKIIAPLLKVFYNAPSTKFQLIGITGTNGKTTTATLLYQLFSQLGYKCGLVSTVKYLIGNAEFEASHTTPDIFDLYRLFNQMANAACQYVFMEVSSHAIVQGRIEGLDFNGGIFTNISHDHLDFHETFNAYIKAKKQFFDGLPKHAFALTNIDDKRGEVMLQNTAARKQTYALKSMADYKGKVLSQSVHGLELEFNRNQFHTPILGDFNAYNLLAVFATAQLLGLDKLEALQNISSLKGAEGRFTTVADNTTGVTAIVDYAHTPDALSNLLEAVNNLNTLGGKVICLVGCGGDRDRKKRPLMAQIACNKSHLAILTSDNPRTENPDAILDEMYSGLNADQIVNALRKTSRREAITYAVSIAQQNDIIVIAGKGHETYQEINGQKMPFDDKAIVEELFKKKANKVTA